MQIHWKPQPKQAEALSRTEDEILYGGARGGGKTDAGQAWLLYDKDHPQYRALVIRKTAKDLGDWIDRAKVLYGPTGAEFIGNEIRFPSGAKIRTGHLNDEKAYSQYKGHEYQKMLLEELTDIGRESDYEKLIGSCRSTIPEIKPQVFATTNPDGPGYAWVKRRFNIPDYPTESVRTVDPETGRTRVFIPARVQDNPILMEADPGYIKYLESIQDPYLKEAWLNGSWSMPQIEGAYYREQLSQARLENRITDVPHEALLKVHTWWDLGVGDSTSIGFFQVYGNQWRMIDYYEASGEGLQHYINVLKEKGYQYGNHYAPHDIRVRELGSGKSRLEIAQELGLEFQIAPNMAVDDGINAVRMRFNTLWIDQEKCKRFIEAISQYRKEWNDKMGEYKAHPLHDWTSHAADMIRYWAVTPFQDSAISYERQRELYETRERNTKNYAR